MKISNSNNTSFGSRFFIRRLPLGEKIITNSQFGLMNDYKTVKLSGEENSVNERVNTMIDHLISKIQKKFSKQNNVVASRQYNYGLMLEEDIIDVDNGLDSAVEQELKKLNSKKKTHFWQGSYNPQIQFCKFENKPKQESYLEKTYAMFGTGTEL